MLDIRWKGRVACCVQRCIKAVQIGRKTRNAFAFAAFGPVYDLCFQDDAALFVGKLYKRAGLQPFTRTNQDFP